MADEHDCNVVKFKRPDLSEEFRRKTYADRRGECQHAGTKIVDEKERTVECESCKAVLDPLMCLLEIATEWRTSHGPRLQAIREYMNAKRQDKEDFAAWWQRVGKGRIFRTKKDAAEQAFWAASSPDLALCAAVIKGDAIDTEEGA
jgi:hypothetical protein